MSHRSKIIKEWVEVSVTASGQLIKNSIEVDKHAAAIIGIAITSSHDVMLYFRGSQRITINDMEIFPENYESKMLFQGVNIQANERIIGLGEELAPGNRKVELDYKDTDHPSAPFVPYKVRLYVFSRIDNKA